MVTADRASICKHCKKHINGKAKLVGLTFICPYCGKPSEELFVEKEKHCDENVI